MIAGLFLQTRIIALETDKLFLFSYVTQEKLSLQSIVKSLMWKTSVFYFEQIITSFYT